MLAFQVADIYQVQAFRGHEKQYMRLASAWSVVFLIAISVSFFAKAGDQFSRAWLGAFYVLGLFALIAFRRGLFLLVRRWTHEGRLDRRTVIVGCDSNGETLIRSLGAQRDSDVRLIGVFDDRNDERSPTSAAGVPKLGTVDDLVDFARHYPRRSRDLLAADLGRRTASCRCSRSSGCCRSISGSPRTPTSCATVRAPIPMSATFPCSTSSTSRSPTGTW